ncbi:serine/threonine kinase [Podospora appendiculata]|uniref:Serine/threonine kinase n=1 Tax=Podospora appendiculata TaxID=314037 RepID=A0AAE0XB19_9PEZI|nr:serine/threonine kinase [Podospora appendiculata]
MELIECSEGFLPQPAGEPAFHHTAFVLHDKVTGRHFWTWLPGPDRVLGVSGLDSVDPKVWEGLEHTEIPPYKFQPLFEPKMIKAPNPLPSNSYIKRPSLIGVYTVDDIATGLDPATTEESDLVLQELQVCETLMKHPHPNIAQYYGAVVENDRVSGLCFAKYGKTLLQLVQSKIPFDKEAVLGGIEKGLEHLHDLGLVHNDINPSNIMLDDSGTAVIIDFDSCRPEGEKVGIKGGSYGWSLEDMTHSRRENDEYGLEQMRKFVEGQRHG